MSTATAKMCDGPASALQPIRMADMLKKTPAATPSATPTPSQYKPPSLRKEEEKKPKDLTQDELSSATLFPSLRPGQGKTMAQIKERMMGAATPAPSTPTSANPFAALDDDASATPNSAAAPSLDFKAMMKERIRRDHAEAAAALEEMNTTDPQKMSTAKLEQNGWGVLRMPPTTSPARQTWFQGYTDRLPPVKNEDEMPVLPLLPRRASPLLEEVDDSFSDGDSHASYGCDDSESCEE